MSLPRLIDQAVAVAAVLAECQGTAELDVHPNERVLIMLPDGPGFDESFAGAVHQNAVPLPVSPQLCAHNHARAGAHSVVACADRLDALAELDAEPGILINGPNGPWIAALRLRYA